MTGIVVGKFHALFGKLIDVRCLDDFLPITAQISVAQIIHHDIDNIWFICGLTEIRKRQQAKNK
jgi:hypothetical protein